MPRLISEREILRSRFGNIPSKFARSYDRQVERPYKQPRRATIVSELIGSRTSRTQGVLDIPPSISIPSSDVVLGALDFLLGEINPVIVKSISLYPENLLLRSIDISMMFSNGVSLENSNLSLSEEIIRFSKTLQLQPIDIGLSSDYLEYRRQLPLSITDILLDEPQELNLDKYFVLEPLRLALQSLDISIDAEQSGYLQLEQLNLSQDQINILRSFTTDDTVIALSTDDALILRRQDFNEYDTLKLGIYESIIQRFLSNSVNALALVDYSNEIILSRVIYPEINSIMLYETSILPIRAKDNDTSNLKLISILENIAHLANIEIDNILLGASQNSIIRYSQQEYVNNLSLSSSQILIDDGGGTPPSIPMLDDLLLTAKRAFSTRLLTSSYAGSCMRVRETGSDTEALIGFDSNGDLDLQALSSHCGSNDGRVVVWFDQCSGGYNLRQTNTAEQPYIFSAGNTITLGSNNKPSILFSGSNVPQNNLNLEASSNFGPIPDQYSYHMVQDRPVSGVVGYTLLNIYYTYAGYGAFWNDDNYIYMFAGFRDNSDPLTSESFGFNGSSGIKTILAARDSDTSAHSWINASLVGTMDPIENPVWFEDPAILNAGTVINGQIHRLPEVITFEQTLDSSDATSIHSNCSDYWGYI